METEMHAEGPIEASWATMPQATAPVVEPACGATIADAVPVPWEQLAAAWGSPP